MTYTVVAVYTDNGQVLVDHAEVETVDEAIEEIRESAECAIAIVSVFEGTLKDFYSTEELMEVWKAF